MPSLGCTVARPQHGYSFSKAPRTLGASKDSTTLASRSMLRSFTWRAIGR